MTRDPKSLQCAKGPETVHLSFWSELFWIGILFAFGYTVMYLAGAKEILERKASSLPQPKSLAFHYAPVIVIGRGNPEETTAGLQAALEKTREDFVEKVTEFMKQSRGVTRH